jgi:hypothetical protein
MSIISLGHSDLSNLKILAELLQSQRAVAQKMNFQKKSTPKARSMTQVVEHLLGKHKALSSNSSMAKK